MTAFEGFLSKHGAGANCRRPSEDVISRYDGVLPDQLLTHWREAGWCSYADGLLWVVDPDELRAPLSEWLDEEEARGSHPIIRTALADVIYWTDRGGFYLDARHAAIFEMTNNIELIFEYSLANDGYLDDAVGRKLSHAAIRRLGALEPDECYGFFPALAAGGKEKAANLQRVKLREHLSILAQLDRPQRR